MEVTCGISVLLYYRYVDPIWSVEETSRMQEWQEKTASVFSLSGRVRVSREGLNANLSGKTSDIDAYCTQLLQWRGKCLSPIDFKLAPTSPGLAFRGLKVWRSDHLVALGRADDAINNTSCGRHISPHDFHDLLERAVTAPATTSNTASRKSTAREDDRAGGVVLLDARNIYESRLGRFEAESVTTLTPPTKTFSDLPDYIDALPNVVGSMEGVTVAMYCTGGVRCEQASRYLRFKHPEVRDVVQLSGGIHRYLEAFPDGGFWRGLNYVFDRREVHGPEDAHSLGTCVLCHQVWGSYRGKRRCETCGSLILVCDLCQSKGADRIAREKHQLSCELCAHLVILTPEPAKSMTPYDASLHSTANQRNL